MHERAARREHRERMKRRMRSRWKRIWYPMRDSHPHWKEPTEKWVGVMASTHGAPCSCAGCGNPRHHDKTALTLKERREFSQRIQDLEAEESSAQLRREIDATECRDPFCDCHTRYEGGTDAYSGNESATDWMETQRKLRELNVSVFAPGLPIAS